ncbi:MAG TPA: hypothetical protein VFG54_04040 [Prolixibacteraceae bacterium]|nr:hypothetical protein [Prolixibacteraceae bacterium]
MRPLILLLGIVLLIASCEDEMPQKQAKAPRLKKVIGYSSLDKSQVQNMVTYDYDNAENLVKIASFFKDTVNPLIYFEFEYYNDRKLHEDVYNIMGTYYKHSQRITYFYNGNLLIKEELRSISFDEVMSYTEYTHDNRGNLILEARVQPEPYFCWKTAYEYDSNNLKIKTIPYDTEQKSGGYTRHFYKDKLLISDKSYANNSDVPGEEITYSYNDENQLIKKILIREGDTMLLESISYRNSLIAEKIIYEWTNNRGWHYGFKGIDVYFYE